MVTSLNSHTFIFREIDFSNYVKNYRVWSKNKRILGVNNMSHTLFMDYETFFLMLMISYIFQNFGLMRVFLVLLKSY
jgi:hypothetical protein